MKKCLLKLISLTLVSLISINAYSWNAIGHMVVANIAYKQLTPVAKSKVDKLVQAFQTDYPDFTSYTQIAYWADALRSQQINVYTRWHYIDMPFSNDGTDTSHVVTASDNAVWAMSQLQIILKSPTVTPLEEARFLAFFTHITGDLHQPLHTVSLFTSDLPSGDRGGNLYTVKYQTHPTNLHSLWDTALGDFSDSYSVDEATTLAQAIALKYPKSFFGKRVDELNPNDWVAEGMVNAKQYVYSTPINQELSTDYVKAGTSLAEQQVALAGYRLGALLNQILG